MHTKFIQTPRHQERTGFCSSRLQFIPLCLLFIVVLSAGGCTQRPGTTTTGSPSAPSSPDPSIEATFTGAEASLYQSEFFHGAILWAPGVTDIGEVCSEARTHPDGSVSVGFCYSVDTSVYLQAVVEAPSDNALPCPSYVDRIVTLWAIPAGALEDGVVRHDDFTIYAPHGNDGFVVSRGVATAAIARISPETAAAYPEGTDFTPGVFLVNALGHPVQAQVSPTLIITARRVSEVLLSMNGDNGAMNFRNLHLEPTCTEQMVLAEYVQVIEPSEPLSALTIYDCDHPYAPARDGAYWEYSGTHTMGHGVDQVDHRYELLSHRILSDGLYPGMTEWTLVHGSNRYERQCHEAGDVVIAPYDYVTWLPPADSLVPGFTWTREERYANASDETVRATVSSVGEIITTPAGTFDTIRVDWEIIYHDGAPWLSGYERLWQPAYGTLWFAQGVGVVRLETTEMAGVGPGTIVLTLTAYSIP